MAGDSAPIAKAYVQVLPSTKGIKGSLSEAFGSEGTSAGGIFGGNLIDTIKGVLMTAGLGEIVKESLLAGADLQQSLGGVETLFKDSADVVIANAENAYKTAGMSANQYMETVTGFSASLLQGLSGDTQAAAEVADMALTDMSDNANKMGTSMELIQNAYQGFAKQNYTMLDNLKLGYGGTKTEMERLLADAQELSGVEYNIDNLADVYEAIHVIQDEMGITGTTAKEASTTFSGSLASMKAAASDLMANLTLGRDIGPSLTALGDTVYTFMVGNLLPMAGNLLSGLPDVISQSMSMAIQGLNIAANNADVIVQQGIDLVTGIGSAIITALPYLAEASVNIVAALGEAIISTDWGQIGHDTIDGLRSSLDLAASEILGTDGNIVQSVLDAIDSGLPSILEGGVSVVVEMANGILDGLPEFLDTAGDIMDQLLDTILAALPEMLDSGVDLVGQLAAGLFDNVPAVIESITSILAELLATIGSHLPDLLESGISLIGELAVGLIEAIPEVIASIPEIITSICDTFGEWDWGEIGSNIVSGIANGITSAAGAIWEAAKQAAGEALNAAKKVLGINSPSKVMGDEVGKFIPPGVAVGIKNNTKPLTDAVHEMSALTTDTLKADIRLMNATPIAASTERSFGAMNFAINVYASEGQDVEELVELLMQKIQFAITRREEAFA